MSTYRASPARPDQAIKCDILAQIMQMKKHVRIAARLQASAHQAMLLATAKIKPWPRREGMIICHESQRPRGEQMTAGDGNVVSLMPIAISRYSRPRHPSDDICRPTSRRARLLTEAARQHLALPSSIIIGRQSSVGSDQAISFLSWPSSAAAHAIIPRGRRSDARDAAACRPVSKCASMIRRRQQRVWPAQTVTSKSACAAHHLLSPASQRCRNGLGLMFVAQSPFRPKCREAGRLCLGPSIAMTRSIGRALEIIAPIFIFLYASPSRASATR